MPELTASHAITALLAIGIGQLIWFSLVLLRRGIAPSTIWQAMPPLFAIWVLLWPVYDDPLWVVAGIFLLGTPVLIAYGSDAPLSRRLRRAWSAEDDSERPPHMWPLVSLLAALTVAAGFYYRAPEFGFGIALSACLAFPAARLLDLGGKVPLGFVLHPRQTLVGHLGLIVAVALLCGWSIHIYHGIAWGQLLIATTIAGIAASLAHALTPAGWNLPLAALAMGTVLWLL